MRGIVGILKKAPGRGMVSMFGNKASLCKKLFEERIKAGRISSNHLLSKLSRVCLFPMLCNLSSLSLSPEGRSQFSFSSKFCTLRCNNNSKFSLSLSFNLSRSMSIGSLLIQERGLARLSRSSSTMQAIMVPGISPSNPFKRLTHIKEAKHPLQLLISFPLIAKSGSMSKPLPP